MLGACMLMLLSVDIATDSKGGINRLRRDVMHGGSTPLYGAIACGEIE